MGVEGGVGKKERGVVGGVEEGGEKGEGGEALGLGPAVGSRGGSSGVEEGLGLRYS